MKAERRPLVRVAGQILNRPVCVTEHHAAVILAALRSDLNVGLITTIDGPSLDGMAMDAIAADARSAADAKRARRAQRQHHARAAGARSIMTVEESTWRPYDVYDGVAVIEVSGTLTKTWGLDSYSGMTGYDGIKAKLLAAMEDDEVEIILFMIESPGGAVSGLFDLVDLIYSFNEGNGGKLIVTLADEQACSAAQAIHTCGDDGWRFGTRTSELGSIGVIWLWTNVEKAMEQDGIQVRIFRAGRWKAEGNSYEPMADETAERVQATLEEIRDLFIDTAARNLGSRTGQVDALKQRLRETEALTYIGRHARDIGLIDTIASEDQVWARLMERRGRA